VTTPAQRHYKLQYFPLDRFDYLWMASHIIKTEVPEDGVGDPPYFWMTKIPEQHRERLEWRWEREVDLWSMSPQGKWGEMRRLYDDFVERGQLNPLIGHEHNGTIYVVKGNRALCVLRAIRNRLTLMVEPPPLTPGLKRWEEQGFNRIKAKICTCSNAWTPDCPPARFHEWVK